MLQQAVSRVSTPMRIADEAVRNLSRAGLVIACLALVFCTGMTLVEIIMRALFSKSTFMAAELIGYGIASATFFAMPYTFREGKHLRAVLVIDHLSETARRAAEAICGAVALSSVLFAAWHLGATCMRYYNRGTLSDNASGIPLWLPYLALTVATVMLALELVAYLVRVLAGGEIMESGEGYDDLSPEALAATATPQDTSTRGN